MTLRDAVCIIVCDCIIRVLWLKGYQARAMPFVLISFAKLNRAVQMLWMRWYHELFMCAHCVWLQGRI
jgi:hypothetical protein